MASESVTPQGTTATKGDNKQDNSEGNNQDNFQDNNQNNNQVIQQDNRQDPDDETPEAMLEKLVQMSYDNFNNGEFEHRPTNYAAVGDDLIGARRVRCAEYEEKRRNRVNGWYPCGTYDGDASSCNWCKRFRRGPCYDGPVLGVLAFEPQSDATAPSSNKSGAD